MITKHAAKSTTWPIAPAPTQVVDRRKTGVLKGGGTVGGVEGREIDWKRARVLGGTPKGMMMMMRSTTSA
jgi:hypothetical protein